MIDSDINSIKWTTTLILILIAIGLYYIIEIGRFIEKMHEEYNKRKNK